MASVEVDQTAITETMVYVVGRVDGIRTETSFPVTELKGKDPHAQQRFSAHRRASEHRARRI